MLVCPQRGRIVRRLTTLMWSGLALLFSQAASAHDYHELEPIDPALRGFLITLLEDARDEDLLRGAFENSASVSAELSTLLDDLNAADATWLATVDYPELDHPRLGRLPLGIMLGLFSDLTEFARDYEAHGEESFTGDASAKADFERLSQLSKDWWGTAK